MEQWLNRWIAALFALGLAFLLPGSPAVAEAVRLYPLAWAVDLAEAVEPLALDTFIESALIFSGVESPAGYIQEVHGLIDRIPAEIKNDADPKRQAERILKYMHEQVLTVYREEQTRLDMLLESGAFNCVSSAILYAFLVKSLGLEVWGIRTSDHAFCRVQAGREAYDVETTSPMGFDPGTKKEFTDQFGRITGYSYVPPTSDKKRTSIGEKGLLSLILYNRQAFLSERREYAQAVGPAVDAYALLQDSESYDRLIVSLSNLGSWYGMRRRYEDALEFIMEAMEAYGEEPRLWKLKHDIYHNWVVSLIDRNEPDKALEILNSWIPEGVLEEEARRRLSIYAYQVKAQGLARQDYELAARTIREALDKIGQDPELFKSFEAYSHNHFVSLFRKGEYDTARQVLSEALAVMPQSAMLEKDRRLLDSHLENHTLPE